MTAALATAAAGLRGSESFVGGWYSETDSGSRNYCVFFAFDSNRAVSNHSSWGLYIKAYLLYDTSNQPFFSGHSDTVAI